VYRCGLVHGAYSCYLCVQTITRMQIDRALISEAYTWQAYMALFEDKVAAKATTGPNQSDELVQYTALNLQRSRRVAQQTQLAPSLQQALQQVPGPWVWLALSEIWCGDAAQSLPAIAAMAEYSPQIALHVLLRDEHPDLMAHFKTNGGIAIPIVICVRSTDGQVLGHWGPRPAPAQQMVDDHKANPIRSRQELYADLHHWYAKDRTATLQLEFIQKIKDWSR
jgi:hypothetical protein